MPDKEEKTAPPKSKTSSGEKKENGRKPAKSQATKGLPDVAPQEDGFPIVGVGASAGGLHALEGLLRQMPDHIPFALVVVQHLDPKRESVIPKILSRATKLPVHHAGDGEKIVPGRIYVKPPESDLTIMNRTLMLRKPERGGGRLPIDLFFRSLAEDIGDKAIGVVLSGAGSDGSQGVKEIQGAGGMILAQDEEQAEHGGMPRSAIDSGAVDMVLPVEKMAEQLLRYTAHPLLFRSDLDEDKSESLHQGNLQQLLQLIRLKTGHDFSQYKQSTTRRRIARRMAMTRMESLVEYVRYVRESPDEAGELFKDLVINVTSFFRDPQVFQRLGKSVIPSLLAEKNPDSMVRFWVPGCATGEEAYSLAMLFLEAVERTRRPYFKLKIFATDINPDSIQKAREGIFRDNITADVSPERLQRFFDQRGEAGYKVKSTVRDLIVFSVHDITRDAPLVRMDLVSCRNLLIYMKPELQKKVIPIMHYSLNPGGILVLGTSEGVGDLHHLFETKDKRNKIFKKTSDEQPPAYWRHISSISRENRNEGQETGNNHSVAEGNGKKAVPVSFELLEGALAESGSPGVIVDEGNNIVHFIGNTAPFLAPPPGRPTFNVVSMAEEGIRHRLEAGLEEARKTGSPFAMNGLHMLSEPVGSVNVKLTPIRKSEGRFLISFHHEPGLEAQGSEDKSPQKEPSMEGDALLKEKLRTVKQQLQSAMEEFETTNEELKSANEELQANNEELQSTNEELESSKEELQSTNEELETANQELHHKNQELLRAEDDAKNLFASLDVGTLFLDRNLRIKRYTPAVTRMFNLIDKDIGRPIADITTNLSYDRFHEEVRNVIENLEKKEVEVKNRNGQWLSVRMLPYRSSTNVIDGVVITFTDVTRLKKAEMESREAQIAAESIMRTISQPFLVLDSELRVRSANKVFYEAFNATERETVGRSFFELQEGRWGMPDLKEAFEDLLTINEGDQRVYEYQDSCRRDGAIRMTAQRVDSQEGRPIRILLTFEMRSKNA